MRDLSSRATRHVRGVGLVTAAVFLDTADLRRNSVRKIIESPVLSSLLLFSRHVVVFQGRQSMRTERFMTNASTNNN